MAATAGYGVRTPFGVPRGFHGDGLQGIVVGLPCLQGRFGMSAMVGDTAEDMSESDSILGWASIVTHSSHWGISTITIPIPILSQEITGGPSMGKLLSIIIIAEARVAAFLTKVLGGIGSVRQRTVKSARWPFATCLQAQHTPFVLTAQREKAVMWLFTDPTLSSLPQRCQQRLQSGLKTTVLQYPLQVQVPFAPLHRHDWPRCRKAPINLCSTGLQPRRHQSRHEPWRVPL